MTTKSQLARLLPILLFASPLALGAMSIEGVTTRSFSVDELTSLGEVLGAGEASGGRCFLRTNSSEKAGQYFIVDTDETLSSLPAGSKLVLEIILASDGSEKRLELPLSGATGDLSGKKTLYVGLTAELAKEKLLAWRLSLCDASGAELSAYKSFLWEMPKE